MFYKIKSVDPQDNLILIVHFENGARKIYDIKELLPKYKNFEALKDKTLFNLVKVDVGGYGVYWNDYIDIGCDELWYNGGEVEVLSV